MNWDSISCCTIDLGESEIMPNYELGLPWVVITPCLVIRDSGFDTWVEHSHVLGPNASGWTHERSHKTVENMGHVKKWLRVFLKVNNLTVVVACIIMIVQLMTYLIS